MIGRARGLSQIEAYRAAGFPAPSDEACHKGAVRLEARDPTIATEIAAMHDQIIRDAQLLATVDQARVIQELQYLALADIGEVIDFSGEVLRLKNANQIPESVRRAIKSVKVKRYLERKSDPDSEVELTEFTLHDKTAPIEKLAKYLGAKFPDALEHTGLNGGPIQVQSVVPLTENERRARILAFMAGQN